MFNTGAALWRSELIQFFLQFLAALKWLLEHHEKLKLSIESHWKAACWKWNSSRQGDTPFIHNGSKNWHVLGLLINPYFRHKSTKKKNVQKWKCHCRFYRLQNEAVLRGKHPSYQQRHCAMDCVTHNLQRTTFRRDFPLRILRLLGLMGWDDEFESSRKRMAVNTGLKLKNAAHNFFFLYSRISNRVIQCDGFVEWQNASYILKDIRKSTLNLSLCLKLLQMRTGTGITGTRTVKLSQH